MTPFVRVYPWFVAACAVACSSDAGRASASNPQDAGVSDGSPGGGAPATDGAVKAGGGSPSAGSPGSGGESGNGTSSSGGRASGDAAAAGASSQDAGADTGEPATALLFGPYKDTSISMDWNTDVVSTDISGKSTPLAASLTGNGSKVVTLAFATGECGTESWAGVNGALMASVNVPLLSQAGVRYVVSTGGAAGSFVCASDADFDKFAGRWMSSELVGFDFDIEGGQSDADVANLVQRVVHAHTMHPELRYSFTLATLANNDGAQTATSLGGGVDDSLSTYGDRVMAALESVLGFGKTAASWPAYLVVNLMTMDYGAPAKGNCVLGGAKCQMAQSAIQAVYNLHDHWGVPYDHIEITPMIGVNDVSGENFTLDDVDVVAAFAVAQSLAGVHYWSYDRDTDCAAGNVSPTCSSMGAGYAGPAGYLGRFLGKLR